MNRRSFLQSIGASAAISAGGIALLELAVPKRTFFLPPTGGWTWTEQRLWDFSEMIYRTAVLNGAISLNEARKFLELPPLDDDTTWRVVAPSVPFRSPFGVLPRA